MIDAAFETFLRHELAETERELRLLLARVQRLQDGLGSGPVEFTAEVIRVDDRRK